MSENNEESFESGLKEKRLQHLRQMRTIFSAAAENSSSKAAQAYQRGTKLLQMKDYDNAAAAFREALSENPDFSFSYYGLGEALLGYRAIGEALAAVRQALELNDYHAPSYGLLGEIYLEQGEIEQAINAFSRALELQPTLISGIRGLTHILLQHSPPKKQEAYEIFRRALAAAPTEITIYRAALDMVPPDADLYQELSEILITHKMEAWAIFFLRRAAQISTEPAPLWDRLASILLERGEILAAEVCRKRANGESAFLKKDVHKSF